MITLPGGCYCGSVRFKVEFEDWDVLEGKKKDEGKEGVRTSLCHCGNCKKFFGTGFGATTKLPTSSFAYTSSMKPTHHTSSNGPDSTLHREFCPKCGTGLLEYGQQAEGKNVYVVYGCFDDVSRRHGQEQQVGAEKEGGVEQRSGEDRERIRRALEPKGEFFCKLREDWLGELKGQGKFRKQEIKE